MSIFQEQSDMKTGPASGTLGGTRIGSTGNGNTSSSNEPAGWGSALAALSTTTGEGSENP